MGLSHDPCLKKQPANARNYFVACYLISLAQGETIQGSRIKLRTIRNYLTDVEGLFAATKTNLMIVEDINYIKIVLDAIKQYEKVPDRRYMIEDSMVIWLYKEAQKESNIDSGLSAIVDWIILGRYTGFRKSEWAQSTLSSFERIETWEGNPPLAMILSDFQFLGPNQERLSVRALYDQGLQLEEAAKLVEHVNIEWRHQKNGDHGQKVMYSRDRYNPKYCPTLAALRIAWRALRLGVPSDEPIGVFIHKKRRRFITDTMVAKVLRLAAKEVLNITDPDELKLWSTHSIRVTAANLLHRERFSDSFIQSRLRWKSNSFLVYLRNTIYAAGQHCTIKISDTNLPPMAERTYRNAEPHECCILAAPQA